VSTWAASRTSASRGSNGGTCERPADGRRAARAGDDRDRAAALIVGKDGLAATLGWDHIPLPAGDDGEGLADVGERNDGAGWPDLVLVRRRDRRLIFAELKREGQVPRPEQMDVLQLLGVLAGTWLTEGAAGQRRPGIQVDVVVWCPSDLRDPLETSVIYRVLR
jgi:hypothetical protein